MRRGWEIQIVPDRASVDRPVGAAHALAVAALAALTALVAVFGAGTVVSARDARDADQLFRLGPGPASVTAEDRSTATDRRLHDLQKLVRRAGLLSASLREAADSARLHPDLFLSRPSVLPVVADDAWISSGFSSRRFHPILHPTRPHDGIDISAPYGSVVHATARGRVTFAGAMPGYGKLVVVDHGYGYETRYAHASRLLVDVGRFVERGEPVAEVGRSGLTTAPNLHYEIRVDGEPVNPRPYLLDEARLD